MKTSLRVSIKEGWTLPVQGVEAPKGGGEKLEERGIPKKEKGEKTST